MDWQSRFLIAREFRVRCAELFEAAKVGWLGYKRQALSRKG